MGFVVASVPYYEWDIFAGEKERSAALLARIDAAVAQQRGWLPAGGQALQLLSPQHAQGLAAGARVPRAGRGPKQRRGMAGRGALQAQWVEGCRVEGRVVLFSSQICVAHEVAASRGGVITPK